MNSDANIERWPQESNRRSPPDQARQRSMTMAAAIEAPSRIAAGPARALDGRDGPPEKILIELSPAQVDRVVRGAAESGNMSVLLSGLKDVREVLAREPRQ